MAIGSRVGDVPMRAVGIAVGEYCVVVAYRLNSRRDCKGVVEIFVGLGLVVTSEKFFVGCVWCRG